MLLVTGGAFQGQLEYALSITQFNENEVTDGEKCDFNEIYHAKIIDKFHLFIRRILKEEKDIYKIIDKLNTENSEVVIITDEIGCGIVPIDPFERMYRETTGRVCCDIASNSKKVYRVICGIGTVIKE